MDMPTWVWLATMSALFILFALDLPIVDRKPHEVGIAEAGQWVVFYIACAVVFGLGVAFFSGGEFAVEYLAGYVTEYSLSVDNLFIFVIINIAPRVLRKVVPVTDEFHGSKLTIKRDGKRWLTPMTVMMIAIGSAELVLALNSIPAVFGLAQELFVVFTANAFALMGLRQLYFLIGGLLNRLVCLSPGLGVILGFIGVKLVLEALHENSLPFINGGQRGSTTTRTARTDFGGPAGPVTLLSWPWSRP